METSLGDQVQWSMDGDVGLVSRNNLLLLSPNPDRSVQINGIDDIFTTYRLDGTLSQWKNPLALIVCNGEVVRAGQAQRGSSNQLNQTNLIELSWSQSGVSQTARSMVLAVTDAMTANLLKVIPSEVEVVCNLNELIARIEGIDTSKVIEMEQLAQLRVHSVPWVGKVKYSDITSPIWPLKQEAAFVVFTEASKTWVYGVKNDQPYRLKSFETGLEVKNDGDEYVRKAKISDWIDGTAYIGIVTTKNRVIVKKIGPSFDVTDVKSQINAKGSVVSTLHWKRVDGIVVLTIVTSKKVEFVFFGSKAHLSSFETSLYGTTVQCNSIAQWSVVRDVDNHIILHTLVSNAHKDLIYLRMDLPKSKLQNAGPIVGKRFNYKQRIESEELAIFAQLTKLNESGPFRINSLAEDPSGGVIGMVTSMVHPSTPIDGRIVSNREDVAFSVIPTGTFDGTFNTIQASPAFLVQLQQLSGQTVPLEPLEQLHSEVDESTDPITVLQSLMLSSKLEQIRVRNILGQEPVNKSALTELARIVVRLVEAGSLQVVSERDRLAYASYRAVLGLASEDSVPVELEIPGMDLTVTFVLDNLDDTVLTSTDGHRWKRCALTLLPLLEPRLRSCVESGIKVLVEDSENDMVGLILRSLPLCIISGGRYEAK